LIDLSLSTPKPGEIEGLISVLRTYDIAMAAPLALAINVDAASIASAIPVQPDPA
jgi:hypothetical protein